MLERKAMEVAKYFVEREIISREDIEIYSYGMLVLFYYLLNIASFLLLALTFGYLLESIVFLMAFSILRMFIGGYHSSTHMNCYIISMLLYVMFLFIIPNAYFFNGLVVTTLLLLSGTTILLFAPGDTENKRLTKKERRRYKRNGVVIYISEVIIIFALIVIGGLENVVNSIILAIILSSLLLIILKIMEERNKIGKENIKQSY